MPLRSPTSPPPRTTHDICIGITEKRDLLAAKLSFYGTPNAKRYYPGLRPPRVIRTDHAFCRWPEARRLLERGFGVRNQCKSMRQIIALHCTSPPQNAPLLNDWFGEGIVFFAFMICGCFVNPQGPREKSTRNAKYQEEQLSIQPGCHTNKAISRPHDQRERGDPRGIVLAPKKRA